MRKLPRVALYAIATLVLVAFGAAFGAGATNAATVFTNDDGATYTGTWSVESTSNPASAYYAPDPYGANNGDFHLSSATGSQVSYTFTGNSITVLGSYADTFGKADVKIDGGTATTIDLFIKPYEYATAGSYGNMKHNRAIFIKDGLANGPHTIEVTVTGTKNAASSGYAVAIDGFTARDSNLAQGVSVSSTSSYTGAGWGDAKLVDGQTSSVSGSMGWSSNSSLTVNHQESVQVDLGDTNFIDRIDLYPRNDGPGQDVYFPIDFTIQISNDNSTWTTVVQQTGYAAPGSAVQTFRIGAQTARYVKVVGTTLRSNPSESNYYRMQLAELAVRYDRYQHSATATAASNATYYVSSNTGSDSNNGTSSSTPWKTLTKASTMTYSSGNSILLKRGDSWAGETLNLHGNGTSANPISVSAYGSGAKPIITGNDGIAMASIKIVNNHGYRISGLELTGGVFGLEVLLDSTYGHDYLYLDDLYVHDIEGRSIQTDLIFPYPESYFGVGILVSALMDQSMAYQTVYSNITLTNSVISQTDAGYMNLVRDKPIDPKGTPTNAWYSDRDAFSTVNISNTQVYRSYRSGGVLLYATSGGATDNVLIDETGYLKGMFWGTAAFQITNSENYTIRNSEFMRTYRTNGSVDGEGVDFESGNLNVTLQNSFIHDNEGPGFMFYGGNGGWGLNNSNITVDGVFAFDNGTEGAGYDSKAIKNFPANSGIVQNTLVKMKFVGQDVDSSPVVFDYSNYIANPDASQAWGPGRTRWGLDKPVTASSDVNGYGYALANVVDGITSAKAGASNTVNGWSSNNTLSSNHTEWVQVDLTGPRWIGEVDLWANDRDSTYFPKDFTIEVSTDGTTWTTVATETNYAQPSVSSAKQAFTITPQYARYVKVTGTSLRSNPAESNYYRMQCAEIDVMQLY